MTTPPCGRRLHNRVTTQKCGSAGVTSITVCPTVRDPEQLNSRKGISLYFIFFIYKVKELKIKALSSPFSYQPSYNDKITMETNLEELAETKQNFTLNNIIHI